MAFVAVFILLLFLFYTLFVCSKLFRSRKETEKALMQISSFFEERRKVSSALLESGEESAIPREKKEKLLEAVRQAEAAVDLQDKSSKEHLLKLAIMEILSQNAPESSNFARLKEKVEGLENEIENARRSYNQLARNFNMKVEHFPTNIFARMMGMKEIAFLNMP